MKKNVTHINSSKNKKIIKVNYYYDCKHEFIEVDPHKSHIRCSSCNELLDPINWLVSMANYESRLNKRLMSLEDRIQRAEAKNRCKCQHCGSMTKIEK